MKHYLISIEETIAGYETNTLVLVKAANDAEAGNVADKVAQYWRGGEENGDIDITFNAEGEISKGDYQVLSKYLATFDKKNYGDES